MSEYNLNYLAKCLKDTFILRIDLYPRQSADGSYACIKKPLSHRHVVVHLQGKMTMGTYVLSEKSEARFIVFDADDDTQFDQLKEISTRLSHQRVPTYVESSRRGGHMWLFFKEEVSGIDARIFGEGICNVFGISDIEMFPKQDFLVDGPGSLIRLPFGIHCKSGKVYGFIGSNGEDLAKTIEDQVILLSKYKSVLTDAFEEYWQIGKAYRKTGKNFSNRNGKDKFRISDRIKAEIGTIDFISKYVELSPSGRGLCPFHDDHKASFSVNIEKNYWKCFAGCGGGSVVDFWMMWRNIDF